MYYNSKSAQSYEKKTASARIIAKIYSLSQKTANLHIGSRVAWGILQCAKSPESLPIFYRPFAVLLPSFCRVFADIDSGRVRQDSETVSKKGLKRQKKCPLTIRQRALDIWANKEYVSRREKRKRRGNRGLSVGGQNENDTGVRDKKRSGVRRGEAGGCDKRESCRLGGDFAAPVHNSH